MLINCHFADAQFRSNLPIFQFLPKTEIEYLAGLWREFSIHISQNCLVLFGLPVYFGNRRFQGSNRRRSIGFQKMKDRVHHLLKADTSPSIAPLETTIAEIDKETDKYEAILAYMNAELTPQTRKVLDLRFRQKLKYREIATELGISEVAVYKHLAQGIRKLKQKFNP